MPKYDYNLLKKYDIVLVCKGAFDQWLERLNPLNPFRFLKLFCTILLDFPVVIQMYQRTSELYNTKLSSGALSSLKKERST